MTAWYYQHGLLRRLLWPLQMYKIALSRVERIQQYSNKYLRKWLGFLPCFSKVGLYSNSGNLQLQISSLVEELKTGKILLHMMMKDLANEVIRKAYPEIKSGTKWLAVKAAQEAEWSRRIKYIIGVTQTNRAGQRNSSNKSSKEPPKGKSSCAFRVKVTCYMPVHNRFRCTHGEITMFLRCSRSLLRAQCEAANLSQPKNPQFSFTRKVNALWGNKNIPIWSYWMELVTGRFQS